MKEFTKKYNEIMGKYSKGEFGTGAMSLGEILEKAGERNLFDLATLEELEDFKSKAVGNFSKMAWGCAIKQWKKKNKTK